MSEKLLNASQIGTAIEKMSGKRMSKQVGVNIQKQGALPYVTLENSLDGTSCYSRPPQVEKEGIRFLSLSFSLQKSASRLEVASNRLSGLFTKWSNPLLTPLAPDPNEPLIE